MAFCHRVRDLFQTQLAVRHAPAGCELDAHIGLHEGHQSSVAINCALGLYALYRIYNALKHRGIGIEDVDGAFGEFLREGRGLECEG